MTPSELVVVLTGRRLAPSSPPECRWIAATRTARRSSSVPLRHSVVRPLLLGGAAWCRPPDFGGVQSGFSFGSELKYAHIAVRAAGERDVAVLRPRAAPRHVHILEHQVRREGLLLAGTTATAPSAAWVPGTRRARLSCSSTRIRIVVPPQAELVCSALDGVRLLHGGAASLSRASVWTTSWSASRRPDRFCEGADRFPSSPSRDRQLGERHGFRPRFESTLSARSRCSSPACAPRTALSIPSCHGGPCVRRFARTTGTPSRVRDSTAPWGSPRRPRTAGLLR